MFFRRQSKPTAIGGLRTPSPKELYPESKELQRLMILKQGGDADAAYKLAMYHTKGARQDSKLALGYLRKGADNGHADSRLLSLMILMDEFNSPAPYGFSLFCATLAMDLLAFNTNRKWFLEEVESGSLTCRFIRCIDKIWRHEESEALTMLFEDAKAGSKLAMGALAYCYQRGYGMPQTHSDAYVWFNVAAAFGLAGAAQDRDRLRDLLPPDRLIDAQQKAVHIFEAINCEIRASTAF